MAHLLETGRLTLEDLRSLERSLGEQHHVKVHSQPARDVVRSERTPAQVRQPRIVTTRGQDDECPSITSQCFQSTLASTARPPVARNFVCWGRVGLLLSCEARLKQDALWNLAAGVAQICSSCHSLQLGFWLHSTFTIPWPMEVSLCLPQTRVVTAVSVDEGTMTSGRLSSARLEPETPRTEMTHTELYCSLTLVWVLGCLFFLRVWWHRHCSDEDKASGRRTRGVGQCFGNPPSGENSASRAAARYAHCLFPLPRTGSLRDQETEACLTQREWLRLLPIKSLRQSCCMRSHTSDAATTW